MKISFKTRATIFDIGLLSVIGVIGEIISAKALGYYSGFYFSVTLVLAFLAIYRNGVSGAIVSIAVACAYVSVLKGATIETWFVYILGNSCIVFVIPIMNMITKERMKANPLWTGLYALTGYLFIVGGRSIVRLILEPEVGFINSFFLIVSNELLSLLLVMVFVAMLSKQKQLFIDIKALYQDE